jgi:RimJ/RimL family protein N-acetyltransferase
MPLDARLAAALSIGNFAALRMAVANLEDVADELCAVAEAHRALYARTGAEPPWIGYLARDVGEERIVGVCGFKDACREGRVEIAYFTFPASQAHGYGKAMAQALVELALAAGEVREVIAHTLPAENASTAILKRAGFDFVGAVQDAEDGLVWRWCLARAQ